MQSPPSRIDAFPVLDHFFNVTLASNASNTSEMPNVLNLDSNFAEEEWFAEDPGKLIPYDETLRTSVYFGLTPKKELLTPVEVRHKLQLTMTAGKVPIDKNLLYPEELSVRKPPLSRTRDTAMHVHQTPIKLVTPSTAATMSMTMETPVLQTGIAATPSPPASGHSANGMNMRQVPSAMKGSASSARKDLFFATPARDDGKEVRVEVEDEDEDDDISIPLSEVSSEAPSLDSHSTDNHQLLRGTATLTVSAATQTVLSATTLPDVSVESPGIISMMARSSAPSSSALAQHSIQPSHTTEADPDADADTREQLWTSVASIPPQDNDDEHDIEDGQEQHRECGNERTATPNTRRKGAARPPPGPLFRHSPGLSPISSSLRAKANRYPSDDGPEPRQGVLDLKSRRATSIVGGDDVDAHEYGGMKIHAHGSMPMKSHDSQCGDQVQVQVVGHVVDVGCAEGEEEEEEEEEGEDLRSASLHSMSFIGDVTAETTANRTVSTGTSAPQQGHHGHAHARDTSSFMVNTASTATAPHTYTYTRPPLPGATRTGTSTPWLLLTAPPLSAGVSRTYPGSGRVGIYTIPDPASKISGLYARSAGGMDARSTHFWKRRLARSLNQ